MAFQRSRIMVPGRMPGACAGWWWMLAYHQPQDITNTKAWGANVLVGWVMGGCLNASELVGNTYSDGQNGEGQ